MLRYLFLSLLLCTTVHGASPTFSSFLTNHFRTNGLVISARLNSTQFDNDGDDIVITNVTGLTGSSLWTNDLSISGGGPYGRLTPIPGLDYRYLYPSNIYSQGYRGMEPTVQFLTTGTNTLTANQSSLFYLISLENDPTQCYLQLGPGQFIGQELQLIAYTNDFSSGQFTLNANETNTAGGGKVLLTMDQNWVAANGSVLWLQYNTPNWVEITRTVFGTNYATTNIFNTLITTNITVEQNITVKGNASFTNIVNVYTNIYINGTNVPTINPTIPHYPYKIGENAFDDGAWIHVNPTSAGLGSLTNIFYSNLTDAYYTNANPNAAAFWVASSTGLVGLRADTLGGGLVSNDYLLFQNGGGDQVYLNFNALYPALGVDVDLGLTGGGEWRDIHLDRNIVFAPGETNTLYRSGDDLVIGNGATAVTAGGILITNILGKAVAFRISNGVGVLSALNGTLQFYESTGSSTLAFGGSVFSPTGSGVIFGAPYNSSGVDQIQDVNVEGSYYTIGWTDTLDYSRGAIYHSGTNGVITFDSQSSGVAGNPRPFSFTNAPVYIDKNIFAKLGTGPTGSTAVIDIAAGANNITTVSAAITYAHLTNAPAGWEGTHVETYYNGSGANYLVTFNATWKNPDGASFTSTNNGIVKVYFNTMGDTSTSALQTNVITQIKFVQ